VHAVVPQPHLVICPPSDLLHRRRPRRQPSVFRPPPRVRRQPSLQFLPPYPEPAPRIRVRLPAQPIAPHQQLMARRLRQRPSPRSRPPRDRPCRRPLSPRPHHI
jgi:hypothetical protein